MSLHIKGIYEPQIFGKLSPIGIECDDVSISYSDFYDIGSIEANLIERIMHFNLNFSETEKQILRKIDAFLDIPSINIILENDIYKKYIIR